MATGEQEQIETERKYDVDAGFVVPDLAGAGGSVSMAPPDVQLLEATYFDTDDLRLIGAHITLRRRTGGDDAGWHIKLPGGGDTRRDGAAPGRRVWRGARRGRRRPGHRVPAGPGGPGDLAAAGHLAGSGSRAEIRDPGPAGRGGGRAGRGGRQAVPVGLETGPGLAPRPVMNGSAPQAPALPQQHGIKFVTDGGMETDLIFH